VVRRNQPKPLLRLISSTALETSRNIAAAQNETRQHNHISGRKIMLRKMRATFKCVQRSATRQPSLRRALCSALLLGFGMWGAPAFASPTWVAAPDGAFQGKFDSNGTMREFLGMR
jgi:hypothetical protein